MYLLNKAVSLKPSYKNKVFDMFDSIRKEQTCHIAKIIWTKLLYNKQN